MTGEVTLRGNVLRIGGAKEKVLAAHRAGITKVLVPEPAKKILTDLPDEVRKALTIEYVDRIEQVLEASLGFKLNTNA